MLLISLEPIVDSNLLFTIYWEFVTLAAKNYERVCLCGLMVFFNHHAKELPRLNTSNLLLTQSTAYNDLSGLWNFLFKYYILGKNVKTHSLSFTIFHFSPLSFELSQFNLLLTHHPYLPLTTQNYTVLAII